MIHLVWRIVERDNSPSLDLPMTLREWQQLAFYRGIWRDLAPAQLRQEPLGGARLRGIVSRIIDRRGTVTFSLGSSDASLPYSG
jgi:hypothetical protein